MAILEGGHIVPPSTQATCRSPAPLGLIVPVSLKNWCFGTLNLYSNQNIMGFSNLIFQLHPIKTPLILDQFACSLPKTNTVYCEVLYMCCYQFNFKITWQKCCVWSVDPKTPSLSLIYLSVNLMLKVHLDMNLVPSTQQWQPDKRQNWTIHTMIFVFPDIVHNFCTISSYFLSGKSMRSCLSYLNLPWFHPKFSFN